MCRFSRCTALYECSLLCCLLNTCGTSTNIVCSVFCACGRASRVLVASKDLLLQEYVRRKHKNIPIEVETRTLDEVKEVLQFLETDKHSLVKRLMLDNMAKPDSSAQGI